jgi:hypothetical protein
MILGDVLATIAVVFFAAFAVWAGGLLAALLFPDRTEQASHDFEHRPWVSFFLGLLGLGAVVVFGLVLIAVQKPLTSSVAVVAYGAALLVSVFGMGGLYRLVARRVRKTGGAESDYAALARAGLLVVGALVGTFLLTPYVIVASFGAGLRAILLFRRRHSPVEAPPQPETP